MALSKIYTDNTVVKKSNGGTLAWVATKPYKELFGENEFDLSILLNNSSTSKMLNNGAYGDTATKYNSANVVASGAPTTPIQFLGCFLSTNDSYNVSYGINVTQKITMDQENIGGDSWQQFIDNFRFIVDFVPADDVDYQNYQNFDYYNTTKIKYGFSSTYLVFNALYNTNNEQLFNRIETSNPESITGDDSKRFLRASLSVVTTNYNKFMGQYDTLTKETLATLWYVFRVNGDLIIIRDPDYTTPSSDYNKVRFLLADGVEKYLTIGGFSETVIDGTKGGLPDNDDAKGLYVGTFAVSGQFRQCNFYYSTNNAIMHNANSTGIRWTVNDITTAKNFRDYVRLGVMDTNGLITHNKWIQGEVGISNSGNPNKNGSYSDLPEWNSSGGDSDDSETDMEIGSGYSASGMVQYYNVTSENLQKLSKLMSNVDVVGTKNLLPNLVSLKAFPIPFEKLGRGISKTITLGGVEMTDEIAGTASGITVDSTFTYISCCDTFVQGKYGSSSSPHFLDFSPYTQVELILPLAGSVILPDNAMYKSLKVMYVYDIVNGSAICVVKSNGTVIATIPCTISQDIPFSATNVGAKTSAMVSNLTNVAQNVATLGVSMGTGNVVGAISSGIGTVGSIAQAVMANNQNYIEKFGRTGDMSDFGLVKKAYIKYTRPVDIIPENFGRTNGYLCNVTKKLSDCKGFTMCENVNINVSATGTEKQMIKQLLETGIYI